MIHLTLTGVLAGTPICGVARESANQHAHAVWSPLHNPEFRDKVCPQCLRSYAESYEAHELAELDDDHWIKEILKDQA